MAQTLREQAVKLPTSPGVYLFKDPKGAVVYVGKSLNIRDRVKSHMASKFEKSQAMVEKAVTVDHVVVENELEALLLEAALIKKHMPRYNSRVKDDKHPLYIKITTKDEFPKVSTARLENEPNAVYFGPFHASSIAKKVLKDLRKIFTFCTQRDIGKKPCFYSHLGLCHPCPSSVSKINDEALKSSLKREYRKNINSLLLVLKGKTKQLIKKMESEMKEAVEQEAFEEAAKIRDQIKRLQYVTTPYKSTKIYLENPRALSDLREEEAERLKTYLLSVFPNLNSLKRIEYLDVAHIAGSSPTASLIVFIEGEPDKNMYRRFKILSKNSRDDFAMIGEVVKRRLKHLDDWGEPDLIIVDGGKPQVSAARSVFASEHVSIPLIGFAKRFEEIITKNGKYFEVMRLKEGDPALNLLRRLETEAHRFARSYHFKLRLKEIINA